MAQKINLPRWAQRVAAAEYIYACLMRNEADVNAIIAGFKQYQPDAWQEAIIANFAYRYDRLVATICTHLDAKYTYAQIEPWLKAVLLSTLAEQYAHKTARAVLIAEALKTIAQHADPVLKKLAHAILDRALRPDGNGA